MKEAIRKPVMQAGGLIEEALISTAAGRRG
jgi:hypothetical protein